MLNPSIRLIKILTATFAVVVATSAAYAAGPGSYTDSNPLQYQMYRELLGSNPDTPGVRFPGYPRTWVQKELIDTNSKSSTVKLATPGVPGIELSFVQKFSISYTYSKKITFVAAGAVDAGLVTDLDSNKVTMNPASGPVLAAIRRLDPNSQRNYFVVDKNHPMIGFCAYELKLNKTQGASSTLSAGFLGSNVEGDNSQDTQQNEIQIFFSQLFQIDSTVPENDYLTVKCAEHFQNMVRANAEYEFSKIMIEQNQIYGSECREDNECVDKLNGRATALFPSPLSTKGIVARCLQKTDATRSCYARSTEGMACPLYKKKDGTLTEKYQGLYTEATSGGGQQCDSGLKCVVESNILFHKFAYCRKK